MQTVYQGIVIPFHLWAAETDQRHLQHNAFIAAVSHLPGKHRQHTDIPEDHLHLDLLCVPLQLPDVFCRHIHQPASFLCGFHYQKVSQIPDELIDKLGQILSLFHHPGNELHRSLHLIPYKRPHQFMVHGIVHRTQHLQDIFVRQLLSEIEGYALLQQAQAVPKSAVRLSGNIGQRPVLRLDPFPVQKFLQPFCNGFHADAPEIISLAAGQDRKGYLVRLCGSQDKDQIRGRLLQRL